MEQLNNLFKNLKSQIKTGLVNGDKKNIYLNCKISSDDKLITEIATSSFKSFKWNYINEIGNKLKNSISKNITVKDLSILWLNQITALQNNLENDFHTYSSGWERFLLTPKKMVENLKELTLNNIILKSYLDPIDLIQAEKQTDFIKEVKRWASTEDNHLDLNFNNQSNWLLNKKELAQKSEKDIICSSDLIHIKTEIISPVFSLFKENFHILEDAKSSLRYTIKNIEQRLLQKENGRLITPLFGLYTKNETNFQLPYGFTTWIGNSAYAKTKEDELLSLFMDKYDEWKENVVGAVAELQDKIKAFNLQLVKEKLAVLFNKTYGKNKLILGSLVLDILVKDIPENKISLVDFDASWRLKVIRVIPQELESNFKSILNSLSEDEIKYISILEECLPISQDITKQLKLASWVPKRMPEPEPLHPTPPPPKRKNPIIVFKSLESKDFDLILTDSTNKTLNTYGFSMSLGGLRDFHNLDVPNDKVFKKGRTYSLYIESEGKKSKAQTFKVEDKNDVIKVIFKYKEGNSHQEFNFDVPFMPKEITILNGSGDELQTISQFSKTGDKYWFFALQTEIFVSNSPQTDFYIRLKNKSLVWNSNIQYKFSDEQVVIGLNITHHTNTEVFSVPFSPYHAYLTAKKSKTDKALDSYYGIELDKAFSLGKGIHLGKTPIVLYLNITDKYNVNSFSRKIKKSYPQDNWEIHLTAIDSRFDTDILKNAANIHLNKWRTQVVQAP